LFSQFHLLFKLFIFCRYLATGTTFTAVHYDNTLGISTIRKFVLLVHSVCGAHWKMNSSQKRQKRDGEKYQMLLENVHIFLTVWEQSMGSIYELPNFLAEVQWILTTSVLFYCSHGNCRFTLQIYISWHWGLRKRLRFVCFSGNLLFKLLIQNKLHITHSGPLFTNDTENCPFVFVGDEAFSFSENLTRPYTGHT